QGLPRVEELFEARKPKHLAILSEISGTVSLESNEGKKSQRVTVTNEDGESWTETIPFGFKAKVIDGSHVEKGDFITEGSANPHDVLAIKGTSAVQDYLIQEVQLTYRNQGVSINDKHIEVIVRQMMRKVKVKDAGDTDLLPLSVVDKSELYAANEVIRERIANGETDLKEATFIPMLLGITKASLATDSFLSAASFQETNRVLTDAATKGKSDPLQGLKENVIIGKLVPAGTGMHRYSDIEIEAVSTSSAD
ncbi:MAG TPA: DNA-directed RNA polymerase subunit beta', partial [Ruminococcaceae bacterium]|nr:DNA-directed RNA polymerase subunit beta' [Oscillospiraceae bacterium]